jgi:IPT/TIG domain
MRIFRALGMTAILGFLASVAHAVGLPLVISATVDYTHSTLTITGQNFGSNPSVTLDALSFPARSSSSSQVVASFPSGRTPSSFTPGTLFPDGDFQKSAADDFRCRHRG